MIAEAEKYFSRISSVFRIKTVALSFSLLLLPGCIHKSSDQPAVVQDITEIKTRIKLKDLNGQPISLNKYRGKIIFINFWATWCAPCIKEMPSIEKAKNILKDSDIEFLIASNESVEQIQSFIAKRNLDLHYVQLENLEELNIPALPTTYIINLAGELVFSETGYREWDQAANIELLTKIINSHE